jgi:hypothetical protein
VGSRRECTRILGLEGFRVETVEWEADGSRGRVRISIERRGIRGYGCSGCRRRTWRVRDRAQRAWNDLPWAEHRVTLMDPQRVRWSMFFLVLSTSAAGTPSDTAFLKSASDSAFLPRSKYAIPRLKNGAESSCGF